MPQHLKEILKATSATLIDNCFGFVETATALPRLGYREVQTMITAWDVSSQVRSQAQQNKADILRKFSGFKNHFRLSLKREEKYLYHYMCSAEALPSPKNWEVIKMLTAFIDADPDRAIAQIAATMSKHLNGREFAALGS